MDALLDPAFHPGVDGVVDVGDLQAGSLLGNRLWGEVDKGIRFGNDWPKGRSSRRPEVFEGTTSPKGNERYY